MLAASNMSRITLLKSSFSFGVSSHLVRGSLSFTSSSDSIFSLFGFICVGYGREGAINPHKEQLRRFQERRAHQVELKQTVGVNVPIEERRQGPEVFRLGFR